MGNETATKTVDDLDIDAILADESLFDESEVVAEEAKSDEPSDDEIAAAVGEVEVEEARAEAYVEQEGSSISENPAEPTKAKKPARLKTNGLKPSEILRAKLGSKLNEALIFTKSEAALSDTELDSLAEQRLADIDKLAKKVGEKAVNMILHIAAGQSLSCYTESAIEVAKNKGVFTLKDIHATYRQRYTEGTSSAQSSQMNQLLPFFHITDKSGTTHTLNPDSVYLPLIQ